MTTLTVAIDSLGEIDAVCRKIASSDASRINVSLDLLPDDVLPDDASPHVAPPQERVWRAVAQNKAMREIVAQRTCFFGVRIVLVNRR